jgi:hypothetical protein
MPEVETTPAMIADAAKSERARNIVLRRQAELAFTGPLGLVACAKSFPGIAPTFPCGERSFSPVENIICVIEQLEKRRINWSRVWRALGIVPPRGYPDAKPRRLQVWAPGIKQKLSLRNLRVIGARRRRTKQI